MFLLMITLARLPASRSRKNGLAAFAAEDMDKRGRHTPANPHCPGTELDDLGSCEARCSEQKSKIGKTGERQSQSYLPGGRHAHHSPSLYHRASSQSPPIFFFSPARCPADQEQASLPTFPAGAQSPM